MEKVPIARLKASLAHHMAKVKAGHSLIITDRGRAVAVIEPVVFDSEGDGALGQLVKAGQIRPPLAELSDDFFRERPRFKDPECLLRSFLLGERGTGR